MTEKLTKEFWADRYQEGQIGWDMGEISPPIKSYIDQLKDKSVKLLIPGAGNSYEAAYLFEKGFTDIHILDFAEQPMVEFMKRYPKFPKENVHVGNFFEHDDVYDLIIEQTLFCAIEPNLRQTYADQVAKLLRPGAKLIGLLFDRNFEGGPPFGGTKREYLTYFRDHFESISMEMCYNSYPPRKDTELFIKLIR